MLTCVPGRYVASTFSLVPRPFGGLTASVDSCAEIKSIPSMAKPILAEFGGRCREAMLGVWVRLVLGNNVKRCYFFSSSSSTEGAQRADTEIIKQICRVIVAWIHNVFTCSVSLHGPCHV